MLLLLSSARAVLAMACANYSLQSYFFQKEFFSELIVFRRLNMDMDFTIFFNVILSDFKSKLSLSLRQKHYCEVEKYSHADIDAYCSNHVDNVIKQLLVHASAVCMSRY